MSERDDLADLRAWRDEFALKHGYDLSAMVATLGAMDIAAGDRVTSGEPRMPVSPEVDRTNRKATPTGLRPSSVK